MALKARLSPQPRPRTMPKLTYQDYQIEIPSQLRYEIVDGVLRMVPSPAPYHQEIALRLARTLADFVETHHRGRVWIAPCDVVLSETNVVQPDLFFIARERAHLVTARNIQGAPDLVVEILSPATTDYDRRIKRTVYAQHGVPEYWIVDPAAGTVEVLALTETGYEVAGTYGKDDTLSSPLLEGLTVPLDEVFAQP